MKKYMLLLAVLCMTQWLAAQTAQKQFVDSLLQEMTLEEKLGQLNMLAWDGSLKTGMASNTGVSKKIAQGQVGALFNMENADDRYEVQKLAVENTRLGIPILFAHDVIHGHKIVFPIPLGLSCSWDMDLIEQTAQAAALEGSADGIDLFFSPMVDISRDPRWGRVAEGGGEDPYLGSCIAEAAVRGYQGQDLSKPDAVMACVKHFALYGAAEAGRDYNTVDMSKIKMYQDYLPPYKAAIEAGAGSVMTAFNDINGMPATANPWLFEELLRKDWNFTGFVVTDYTAIREVGNHGLGDLKTTSALALQAGIDMDMVSEGFLYTLKESLKEGSIQMQAIDTACKRILEAKYQLGLFNDPYIRLKKPAYEQEPIQDLSRKAAQKACVLLKNEDGILPLNRKQKIALVGPLADSKADLLGTWVLNGDLSKVSTLKEALQQGAKVNYAKGCEITDNPKMRQLLNYQPDAKSAEELLQEALKATEKADVIVAVLGETAGMSGEAASLSNIGLQAPQKKLLQALVETGKPVVLVLVNGRPLCLPWEKEHCTAILESWAGGTEAAGAITDILYGDYNPSGKLTMTFPVNEGQIPIYHSTKNTGRPFIPGVKYSSQYLDIPNQALYPFGYGLSYTRFTYEAPQASNTQLSFQDTLVVSTYVSNSGDKAGTEIVQLYVHDEQASVTRPNQQLIGFQEIQLQPGEKQKVSFLISAEQLKFYNEELEYIWESGVFNFMLGTSSAETQAVKVNWHRE